MFPDDDPFLLSMPLNYIEIAGSLVYYLHRY